MGAGKTTVGKRLARRLGWEFYDADKEIEARCGVPITTIFDLEGEEGFRRREAQAIDDLTKMPCVVMATGGGAVMRAENREALRRGEVIYLRASVDDLWRRTRHDRSRPLLQTADPRAKLTDLLKLREPMYREVATLVVETGQQPVGTVVDQVLRQLLPLGYAPSVPHDPIHDALHDAPHDVSADSTSESTSESTSDSPVDSQAVGLPNALHGAPQDVAEPDASATFTPNPSCSTPLTPQEPQP